MKVRAAGRKPGVPVPSTRRLQAWEEVDVEPEGEVVQGHNREGGRSGR